MKEFEINGEFIRFQLSHLLYRIRYQILLNDSLEYIRYCSKIQYGFNVFNMHILFEHTLINLYFTYCLSLILQLTLAFNRNSLVLVRPNFDKTIPLLLLNTTYLLQIKVLLEFYLISLFKLLIFCSEIIILSISVTNKTFT